MDGGSGPVAIARREFLRRAAILSASGILMLSSRAWAARALRSGGGEKARLVVVFMRGAVDGLNVVVPYGEDHYYDLRPTIAIPRPGGDGALIDLDGFFGLNPALKPMMRLWREGTLAFVHASGSPNPTRSHFDAQDYIESGTPGVKSTRDGWLNRTLKAIPGAHPPTEALSVGSRPARILSGRMPVANLASGRRALRRLPMDRPVIEAAFRRLYAGDDPISRTFREGESARRRLMAELAEDMRAADGGSPLPGGFAGDARRLATLIRRDSTIRIGFVGVGGWDTHVNQGGVRGQLGFRLKQLGEGLDVFARVLGPAWGETVVIVLSEFGRTVRENGNRGTDHGHGNVMWVMGGPVRGGKVYGRWPGLERSDLYEGRDLAVTTDFREAAAQVLKSHFRLGTTGVSHVFPGWRAGSGDWHRLIRT